MIGETGMVDNFDVSLSSSSLTLNVLGHLYEEVLLFYFLS